LSEKTWIFGPTKLEILVTAVLLSITAQNIDISISMASLNPEVI
jgi:hypothetical protein